MSSSFYSSRKHAREDSSSPNQDDSRIIRSIEHDDLKQKRRRRENERRTEKRSLRVDQADTSKSLEGLDLEKRAPSPTSPKRPTVSPIMDTATTDDDFTTNLDRISTLITSSSLPEAYKLLSTITNTNTWQATATRDSILRIYNYTQLLGDAKKQGMQQASMINEARRKQMEMEKELRELVGRMRD